MLTHVDLQTICIYKDIYISDYSFYVGAYFTSFSKLKMHFCNGDKKYLSSGWTVEQLFMIVFIILYLESWLKLQFFVLHMDFFVHFCILGFHWLVSYIETSEFVNKKSFA